MRNLGIVVLCAALGGCAPAGKGGFTMPPMPVETALVTQGPVFDRFEAVGSVEAGEEVTVVSEINALVKSLPFVEGRPVAEGTVLAQLDDAQLRAEAQRTAALLDQAHDRYDRVKSVVDQGAGAPQDLDDAAAAVKVAEANAEVARAQLAKARITAPFDGIVGAKRVSPGAYLKIGDAITDLAQLSQIKVVFSAPERYLSKLSRGASVAVSTTAYPGYELTGTITVIDPVLDPSTRSAEVIARVRNPGGKFRPGMSANVSAVLSERMNALTVPNEAIFAEGNQTFVYIVKEDSTVARAPLTLGTRLPDAVEVLSGLQPGARVVSAGHQKLFDGAKVLPVQSQAATTANSPSGGEAKAVAPAKTGTAKPAAGAKGGK
jgi:membrane fusion protein (multidrug efflux system)